MENNLANTLRGLANQSANAAPAPTATPAAAPAPVAAAQAPTNDFGGATAAKDPEKEERKKNEEARRSQIAAEIGKSAVQLNSALGKMLQQMSQSARICGYVVKNGPKTDFVAKSIKDKATQAVHYDIRLRQSPPSSVIGVIIKYPARLLDALNKGEELKFEDLANATQSAATVLQIEDKDAMPAILTSRAAGYMVEADEIFQPYYTKSVHVSSLSDINVKKANIPSRSCLFTEIATVNRKGTADTVLRMKHSFRSRLQAPGNYIALKEVDTVPMKMSYSADEAEQMNDLYLSRFTVPRAGKNNEIVMNAVTDDTRKVITVKDAEAGSNGIPVIVSTAYFPTNAGVNWSKDPKLAVADWYRKNPDGTPVMLNLDEIRLVKKERYQNSKGNLMTRVVNRELRDTNASADSYRFDPNGEHKAICAAADGALTFDTLDAWHPKKKGGSKRSTPAAIGGTALAGMSEAAIQQILDRFASKAI